MDNKAYIFNRYLLLIITVAPFVGYLMIIFLDVSLFTLLQLLSYIGVILLLMFRSDSSPIIFPKYLFYYLLFTIYVFYSAFIQLDRDFEIKYLFSNKLIGALNFMFIAENVPISKKHFRLFINISSIILIIAVLVIVIQEQIDPSFFVDPNFRRLDLVTSTNNHENRLLSIYSWIGELSEVGFSFVPLFILIAEYLHRKKKYKYIFVWIFMGVIYALLSKARWIMVNTLLVFVLLFISHRNKVREFVKYLFLVPLIFFIAFLLLNAAGFDAKGIVNKRILENDKKNINQKSAGTRLLAFEAFNKLYWDQPIFGKGSIKYGMGGTGQQDYKLHKFLRNRSAQIHVGYLSVFYMYGLIGGFFFLSFLILLLKRLYRQAKRTTLWGPFLGFLGFAIANLTLVETSIYQTGLILVIVANTYYYQSIIVKKDLECLN